jgi:cupin fold WbuC family metalloprotein
MKVIDERLLDEVCVMAKASPRLRMNYNFHEDLSDKCQRLLNALEPGTIMPIHHHKVDEMFVVLRGKVNVTIHNDEGEVIQSVKLSPSSGNYAVNIKAGEWHSLTCEEADTVIMEVKEGPYIPHEIGGILEVKR